jgi:hypothetical protein
MHPAADNDGIPWPYNTDIHGNMDPSTSTSTKVRVGEDESYGYDVAIPLFDSSGVNCSGHDTCNKVSTQATRDARQRELSPLAKSINSIDTCPLY